MILRDIILASRLSILLAPQVLLSLGLSLQSWKKQTLQRPLETLLPRCRQGKNIPSVGGKTTEQLGVTFNPRPTAAFAG